MARPMLGEFLRRLTRGMAAETLGDRSDGDLVHQFLEDRDEASLQAIVNRHGPMVYRVCWRILQHSQDAEDAFQATFLILAQKLRTVRKQASLPAGCTASPVESPSKRRLERGARRRRERAASSTLDPIAG